MSGISTHVLDSSRGRPASHLAVTLEYKTATGWKPRGAGTTGEDGRIDAFLSGTEELARGIYRLTFYTESYHRRLGRESFYPQVVVIFEITQADEHYHLPLLLNVFGYTTYRGG